jgi:hypothetical protein
VDKHGIRSVRCDYGCRVFSRLAPAALVLALVTGMATGCFAPTEPEDTPLFATEEEAFAAAEETYRAYVDALNQVDLSDPETFEDVYAWTTGEANAGERESLTGMHADGWIVTGATRVISVEGTSYDPDESPLIQLAVCSDVSEIEVVNAAGESMVDENRPALQSSAISLVEATESPTSLLISAIEGSSEPC